jgi:glucose-1-phosphate cytidylyltransferase
MKVVLFCGGAGMRIREYSEAVPKPMVPIGYRPILWHVMRYYAAFGHKDFILCLGYKADVIKNYFRDYDECLSNDFTLHGGQVRLHGSDIADWRITFVDTGINATIGERLMAVRPLLAGEPMFLANYSDGLTDLHLPDMVDHFSRSPHVGTFMSVQPAHSFHLIDADAQGTVKQVRSMQDADLWINGGYFIFRPGIFDVLRQGEDLVNQALQRLIDRQQLATHRHAGFWACMDTYKEKQAMDELYERGVRPWEVWRQTDAVHHDQHADTVA